LFILVGSTDKKCFRFFLPRSEEAPAPAAPDSCTLTFFGRSSGKSYSMIGEVRPPERTALARLLVCIEWYAFVGFMLPPPSVIADADESVALYGLLLLSWKCFGMTYIITRGLLFMNLRTWPIFSKRLGSFVTGSAFVIRLTRPYALSRSTCPLSTICANRCWSL